MRYKKKKKIDVTYFFMSQEYIYNLIFIFSITRDIIDAV